MKKIIYILCVLPLLSCSVQKTQDYNVINAFLEDEISKMPYDTIYIKQEPLNFDETIKLYEQAYSEKDLGDEEYKGIWVSPKIQDWPLDNNGITEIKSKITDEIIINWTKKDFKNKRFKVYPEQILKSKMFIVEHASVRYFVFSLSKPIYSKDKSYALFQFYPSFISGSSSSYDEGVIIMKRYKGKWYRLGLLSYAVYK